MGGGGGEGYTMIHRCKYMNVHYLYGVGDILWFTGAHVKKGIICMGGGGGGGGGYTMILGANV